MKKITALLLALMMLVILCACGTATPAASTSPEASADASASPAASVASGVEDGILTVAMECAYAPYNWTQTDDSNGAVPIKNSTAGEYANGYDVMMAKKLCEANGWELEVERLEWDSLIPAVQTGEIDAIIAGQSMTAKRMEQIDFAGPYLYASIVCLTKSDSKFANATKISDLAGGSCTSQLGTVWYDTCLPQIKGAKIDSASENAPAMLMALESGMVDFVCTDMPTAQAAVAAYPDMKILNFKDSGEDFQVSDEEIDIGIGLKKDNTVLKDALNKVLSTMTADDFNKTMADAIKIQPMTEG